MEWTDGRVVVSTSNAESGVILEFTDTNPFIVVEVKLYTQSNQGFWTFNNNMGGCRVQLIMS